MKYLCSVYSYRPEGVDPKDMPSLMHKRFEYAAKVTADYLKGLHSVFSPILHNHPMSLRFDMPKTWDFWSAVDFQFIDASEGLIVLKMPYWEKSVGINAEIAYATAKGLPIEYVECLDYKE